MGCKTTCLERPLRRCFGRLGGFIGRKPLPFVITPPIVCLVLSVGLVRFQIESDVVYLFTPTNGPAKAEQETINRLFPSNYESGFNPYRFSDFGHFISVILLNETGNVLSDEGKNVTEEVKQAVYGVTTSKSETFTTLCARFEEECAFVNPFELIDYINELLSWYGTPEISHTYPFTEQSVTDFLSKKIDMTFLSGVNTTETGVIQGAKARLMTFFLKKTDEEFIDNGLETLLELNISVAARHPGSKLAVLTSLSLEKELVKTVFGVLSLLTISFSMIVVFACVNCLLRDWVNSKPLIGLCGSLATVLGIGGTTGLLCAAGFKIDPVAAASPFLLMAVGIDDMFVMLSAWRATDPAQAPHERLSHCMSDAAVSITITTVTDILGFGIGALIPFPAIQSFCLCTALGLTVIFIMQITFLAGCMVLDGWREAAKRHAVTLNKIKPLSESAQSSCAYRLLCTGGQEDSRDTLMTRFFRERYGPLLMRWQSRVVVMLLYVCYLAAAIYGITTLEEGLELSDLCNDDSYSRLYYEMNDKYFEKYGPFMNVIVEAPLDYSKASNQARIEDLLRQFEANGCFHGSNQTISWLRSFEKHQKSSGPSFASAVKKFLKESELDYFQYDVKFKGDSISATRYLMRFKDFDSSILRKDCMLEARKIAAESNLDVTVFYYHFHHFDQYAYVRPGTLQNMGTATFAMFVVSLFLIPDPICAVWVVLCIVSILVGVVGFMALWSMRLQVVSMICLIICIGFCVDFSAHITYAYTISKPPRIPNALGLLGIPIIQGGLSTLVGIISLAFFPSLLMRFLFKGLFLALCFGLLHGLVFLPVWLDLPSLCCPKRRPCGSSERQEDSKREENTNWNSTKAGTELIDKKFISESASQPEEKNRHKMDYGGSKLEDSCLTESLLPNDSKDPVGVGAIKCTVGEVKRI